MRGVKHDHHALVERVQAALPETDALCDLADLFKVFGDTTRMRILYLLTESEMCVCAIAECLKMEQSAISHQLKVLKDNRLVTSRREGKTVYYALADGHVSTMIEQGFTHLTENMKQEGKTEHEKNV